MYLPLFVWVLCWSLFGYILLCVLSSFEIILARKRYLVAWLLLSFWCLVTVNDLWLFLTVPWAGLQCVIVVFPKHTNFLHTLLMVNSLFPIVSYHMKHFQVFQNLLKLSLSIGDGVTTLKT